MRKLLRATGVAASFLVAGCAIHPVPEDVTGVTTYGIARQIRCETREAARQTVLTELRTLAAGSQYVAGDPRAQQLLARYDDGHEDISTFRPSMFAGPQYQEVRNYLNMIYTSAIAYSFDLMGDETNNVGTTLDWLGPWLSKLQLGITADANRERSNERLFTLTDTLGDLLMNLSTPQFGVSYCGPEQLVGPNYAYPAAGRIGVDKTLRTFFELNVFTNVTSTGGSSSGNAAQKAPTLTDKLIFTTQIDFSGTPKVTFTPIGKGFQFADASVTGMVKRVDTHKVYVALALEPAGAVSSSALHSYLFPSQQLITSPGTKATAKSKATVVQGGGVTAEAGTMAKQLAVGAIADVRAREVTIIISR